MTSYTLITGASGGIGLAIAHEAHRRGHHLVLVARSTEKLETIKKELGKNVIIVTQDMTAPGAVKALQNTLRTKKITISRLVNNAGYGESGEFIKSDISRELGMIDLNITSLVELTHALLPQLVKTNGHIVNVASVAGFLPGPYMATYYATKAFVVSWSEALSEELRGKVGVTALCPGPTKSEFFATAGIKDGEGVTSHLMSAEKVARHCLDAIDHKTMLAIPGFRNKVTVVAAKFLPKSLTRRLVAKVQRP